MVSERLKQLIFKQLYKELGNVEIIPYKDSIWFIDRENKYWFFEYNDEYLWWRYDFFPSFFSVFSLEREDYEPILSSWVEEVLNHKVSTTWESLASEVFPVEEVLNHKVSKNSPMSNPIVTPVEEILGYKISETAYLTPKRKKKVEDVLNQK